MVKLAFWILKDDVVTFQRCGEQLRKELYQLLSEYRVPSLLKSADL